jgi:hypothetical protein
MCCQLFRNSESNVSYIIEYSLMRWLFANYEAACNDQ